MPFLPPNQQRQSTEGTEAINKTIGKKKQQTKTSANKMRNNCKNYTDFYLRVHSLQICDY